GAREARGVKQRCFAHPYGLPMRGSRAPPPTSGCESDDACPNHNSGARASQPASLFRSRPRGRTCESPRAVSLAPRRLRLFRLTRDRTYREAALRLAADDLHAKAVAGANPARAGADGDRLGPIQFARVPIGGEDVI